MRPDLKRKYIVVTGCPRSGTKYMSLLLRAHGLDVRHEKYGKNGVSWWKLATTKGMVRWFWDVPRSKCVYIHNTRNPIDNISSMMTLMSKTLSIIRNNTFRKYRIRRVEMVMNAWYYWNLLAERRCDYTFAVERVSDGGEEYERFCEVCEIRPNKRALNKVPKNANSRNHDTMSSRRMITISAGMARKIRTLATRYGY